MTNQLASETITSEPRTKDLQNLWKQVSEFTYTKEDAFIAELRENNTEKFQTLRDIISTEIQYSQEQQEKLKDL